MVMSLKEHSTFWGILTVIGAFLLHFTFGHFYTVANMVPYIMGYSKKYTNPDLTTSNAIWLSALALGIQGISMPIGGIVAKKFGFRWVVAISCLTESLAVTMTYFSIQKSFIAVVFTYSLLNGAGLSFGYSVVLAVACSWFPNRRGLVAGIVVGGFGLGSLVFTPVQTAFINPQNVMVDNETRQFTDTALLDRVPNVFLLLGGILFAVQIIGFALLREKPISERDEGQTTDSGKKSGDVGAQSDVTETEERLNRLSPKEILHVIDFYFLWTVMLCNAIPLVLVTSSYKYFGQKFIDDDRFLTGIATVSAVFNSGGRIVWGIIVDKFSFKVPLCVMLVTWAVILMTFPHLGTLSGALLKALYAIWVLAMFFTLSGIFAIMPAATSITFGPKNLAINYGMIFTAFSLGSVLCGIIASQLSSGDTYLYQFTGCSFVCLFAFNVALCIYDRKISPKLYSFKCAQSNKFRSAIV